MTFSVSASGTGPLSYQWQRNTVPITGATSSSYNIPAVSAADNGAMFRCVVSNAAGSAISNSATLTVTGNSGPVPTITQPAEGTLYSGGQTIIYAGTGTDAEDGALSDAAFTWQVDFHHDTHVIRSLTPPRKRRAAVSRFRRRGKHRPTCGIASILPVTDSQGQRATTFRDVRPRTVTITLAAQHAGLQLRLDGQPFTAPTTFVAVVGMEREIGAPTPQTIGNFTYTFKTWTDGGEATHVITIPAADTTYTARFLRSKNR